MYANTMDLRRQRRETMREPAALLAVGERQSVPTGTRRIATPQLADACYFRSRAQPGRRKALLQITERCNLRCAHCFVSATRSGSDMALDQLSPEGINRLLAAGVANVTLTGGEPFIHPELIGIVKALVVEGIEVTVCTNGVSITSADIDVLASLKRVHVNVSLDGFSAESHGEFRGSRASFQITLDNTRRLAAAGLLKGILSTPNALAQPHEYEELYSLVGELGAEYLLDVRTRSPDNEPPPC